MNRCDFRGYKLPDYREDPDREISGRIERDLERESKKPENFRGAHGEKISKIRGDGGR
jgi:hypothetical protein